MKKRALVVDDSATMRDMVTLSLTTHNFDVVTADDGVDAIAKSKDGEFNVIITDINMPNMNGIELIKNLRDTAKFKYLPIIVLTTEGGDDKKMEGRKSGATGWLVKPFDPETLIAVINKVCP